MPRQPECPYYGPAGNGAPLEAIFALEDLLEPAHLRYCDALDAAPLELPLPAAIITIIRGLAFDACLFAFAREVLDFPRSVVAWRDIAIWATHQCRSDLRGRPCSIEYGLGRYLRSFETKKLHSL